MDHQIESVSTDFEKASIFAPPQQLLHFAELERTCVVCDGFKLKQQSQDELLRLCLKCNNKKGNYIHMQCFWKIPNYISKNGHALNDLRKCPTEGCSTVIRLTYDDLTYDFPNYRSQIWLYYLNPIFWILAGLFSLLYTIMFVECEDYSVNADACFGTAYGIHVTSFILFIAALFLKPNEPIIYLETAKCKSFAIRKLFVEALVGTAAILLGFCTLITTNYAEETSSGFSIWLILSTVFVLPTIAFKFFHSHRRMYKMIRNIEIKLKAVSLSTDDNWTKLRSGRTQLLDMTA